MTGATSLRQVCEIRIDPGKLPARWSYRVSAGGRGEQQADVYLDVAGVIVKRRLGGLPLTLSLPFEAFEGVAVDLGETGDDLLARVELRHADPALSVPLVVTRDMEAAADDWREWADRLRLPMLLVDACGDAQRVEPDDRPVRSGPAPRRRNATLARRRPRFLVRRKVGTSGPMPVLTGWREIISYE